MYCQIDQIAWIIYTYSSPGYSESVTKNKSAVKTYTHKGHMILMLKCLHCIRTNDKCIYCIV